MAHDCVNLIQLCPFDIFLSTGNVSKEEYDLKIIAGKFKGRSLKIQNKGLRPTTAIVKASLFNIIGNEIKDKSFVDVFAGTGAVGFEAASRGASSVTFIEQNPEAVYLLNENIRHLGACAQVVKRDAHQFLLSPSGPYDYIFFSPPYDVIHWHKLLRAIEGSKVTHENTIMILQHPKNIAVESFELEKVDERKYGFNKLTFLKKKKEQ